MDPPIHTEYFLSGGAMILILMVDGAKAVISFCILSAIPGYMVVPPDITAVKEETSEDTELVNKDLKQLKCSKCYFKTNDELKFNQHLLTQHKQSVDEDYYEPAAKKARFMDHDNDEDDIMDIEVIDEIIDEIVDEEEEEDEEEDE